MANVRHHWEEKRVGTKQSQVPLFIQNKKEDVNEQHESPLYQ
jgi:hypothetical protein